MVNGPTDKRIIKHIPNALTVMRLLLTVAFLVMVLIAPRYGLRPWRFLTTAFVLFVVAGITDMIDGAVARYFEVTSKFGRIVDPLADKILVCGAFICFAIVGQPLLANFTKQPYNISSWVITTMQWATAVILVGRELAVTVLRHMAEARGVEFGAVVSGKIKMFLQSFGIGTVVIGWAFVSRPWGDWFTIVTYAIMVVVTVYSGIQSFRRPILPEN